MTAQDARPPPAAPSTLLTPPVSSSLPPSSFSSGKPSARAPAAKADIAATPRARQLLGRIQHPSVESFPNVEAVTRRVRGSDARKKTRTESLTKSVVKGE